MLGLLMSAAWLAILITLFSRGWKISWTELIPWLLGLSLITSLAQHLFVTIAGPMLASVGGILAFGGGVAYLLYARFGFQNLRQLLLMMVLYFLPPLFFVGMIALFRQTH